MCTTWGIELKHIFLLSVFRKRLNYPDLKREVLNQAHLWSPDTILIEDRASGTQLIQDLMAEGLSQVTAINPAGDKVMRMHAQTAIIENGFVHFPQAALWLDDYVRELTSFPQTKHDDQVD